MCKINLAGTINDSITDGPGIRFTVFVQGCPHHCKGCHNQHTWEFKDRELVSWQDLFEKIKANPLLDGITLSGGEPMCQAEALLPLAEACKKLGLNIAIYSGFLFEDLLKINNPHQIKLLSLADILVDGKFEEEKRDYRLKFCGSTNQRVIDLAKSLKENRPVLETSERWNSAWTIENL